MDPQVAKALEAGAAQCGPRLLEIDENQWYERKGPDVKTADIVKTIIGFAHSDGGVLVIGLGDEEGVLGIDQVSARTETLWRSASRDRVLPQVEVETRDVPCVNDAGEPDRLLVITVPASSQYHRTTNDKSYRRSGAETLTLDFDERRILAERRSGLVFEDTGMGADLPALIDVDAVSGFADDKGFFGAAGAGVSSVSEDDVRKLLGSRNLLTADGQPTVGAVLMFGSDPQALLRHACVRVSSHLSHSKTTGEDLAVTDDEQFGGTLPRQIEAASEMIERVLPKRKAFSNDSGRFEDVPIIPYRAWREGLVNAVIHRSYSDAGSYINVDVYRDKVVIENPGHFLARWSGADAQDLRSYCRNPKIAQVCLEMSIGQKRGEGIQQIFESMAAEGLQRPIYEQPPDMTQLTLSAAPANVPVESALKPQAHLVLGHLRAEQRSLSTGDLVRLLGVSRKTVITHLNALREAGLVEWTGTSRRDPRARWRATATNGYKG